MDAQTPHPAPHPVPTLDLTDEAFAPFGDIIKPRRGGKQFDRGFAYDPNAEPTHVKLVVTHGEPCLRIMQILHRGLVFTHIARHRRVSQCLGSLQGKVWYMAVAAPTDFADDAVPRLEDIRAFRIPGDRIIKMHVGTWHAGPHFTHDECLFVNLENEDTNIHDFQDHLLPRPGLITA